MGGFGRRRARILPGQEVRAPKAACPGAGMPSSMEDEPPKATAVRLATGPIGWPVGRGWASPPARNAQSMTLLGGAPVTRSMYSRWLPIHLLMNGHNGRTFRSVPRTSSSAARAKAEPMP
jgi:hypothetical protein